MLLNTAENIKGVFGPSLVGFVIPTCELLLQMKKTAKADASKQAQFKVELAQFDDYVESQ